jgi:tetratricopeptide (TPR) repeat protein
MSRRDPDSEQQLSGPPAKLQIAQLEAATKKKTEAFTSLNQVIANGNEEEKIRALKSAASATFNRGDPDAAIVLLQKLETEFPTKDVAGYVRFSEGLYLFAKGKDFYPSALKSFNRVLVENPDHLYTLHSKQMIEQINDITAGKINWPQPKQKGGSQNVQRSN